MAIEFLATWATFARVAAATVSKDRGTECQASLDWPLVMLKERIDRLLPAKEFAEAFSVEELVEMQKNLAAGILRHLTAHSQGYGDALRLGRLKEQAREIHRMSKDQKVLSERHIRGEGVPPREEIEWSENKINHLVASILSLGNESCARLLLKSRTAEARFYLDEIEPRGSKRRTGDKGAP